MSATRDARTAKRKLSELGITSATVLTGPTTITIDLAAFDEMVGALKDIGNLMREAERRAFDAGPARTPTHEHTTGT